MTDSSTRPRPHRATAIALASIILATAAQPVAAVAPVPTMAFEAYLKANNNAPGNRFGYAVDIDGDTAVVGATGVNNLAGAAYVFTRGAGGWTQQQMLTASNAEATDVFGISVAISGETIVVGATGEDSNGTGPTNNGLSDSGAAYVFARSGTTWTQQAYLKASNPDPGDLFGGAVAIVGDTAVIGAHREDSNSVADPANDTLTDAGAAYVFTRSGTAWSQQAYLKPANPGEQDFFGWTVGVHGDTAIVGAFQENGSSSSINGTPDELADNAGAAYVFVRSGSAWTQQAYLKASNAGQFDEFGWSVAISGETAVVGAPRDDSNATGVNGSQVGDAAPSSGAAFVFTRSGSTWNQQAYIKASNTGVSDEFGRPVDIDGDRIIAGAYAEDSKATGLDGNEANDEASNAGAAYLFLRQSGTWSQIAYAKAPNNDAEDFFGGWAAVDGTRYIFSAVNEDSNATTVNGDGSNDSAAEAGAAYILDDTCLTAPFSDVATSHTFCPEIEWMKQRSISTGFDDATYRPSSNVTRQAMSAFMARLAGATLTTCGSSQPFTDVSSTHPFCEEIKWMKDQEISTGFDDGTYRPSINVTRQAMSAFMARLAEATLTNCTVAPFSDVLTTHPFCQEIKWMKEAAISTGFDDGTYRPANNVTRQAMSAFLYRVDDYIRSTAGFGAISGSRDVVAPQLDEPTPSLLGPMHLDFGTDPYDDPADRPHLTPGGQEIVTTPNAGGSATISEVFAFETLARLEKATLLKTETEISYDEAGPIVDLLVNIAGSKAAVSVLRAWHPSGPITAQTAATALDAKLDDMVESSQIVSAADAWVKGIVVVMASDQQNADTMITAWAGLDAPTKAGTIVYVVITDGSDSNIYSS